MATERWRYCLEHGQILIKTDHKSLKYLMEQKIHALLQRKEVTKLTRLRCGIQYRKGKENIVVDAMSRKADLFLNSKEFNEKQQGTTSRVIVVVPT